MSDDSHPAGSTVETGSGDTDRDRDTGTDTDSDGKRDRGTGDGVRSPEPTTPAPATTGDVERDVRATVETTVPPGAPVHRCAYCGRPFAAESYLALHRGLAHADVLSAAEREGFEAAYADEESDLGRFRIVALGLLVLLYFGFLFTFAVVT
jgi:hypothetical protein